VSGWPRNDREWARSHIGCNVTTCPNGKCQTTGECIERVAHQMRLDQKLLESKPIFIKSPSLAPVAESRRTVIAFTGLAGAGKSTAAMHLVERHGFERIRFAGPLKAMMAALGLSQAEIDGNRKEEPCELLGGKTPRFAMQTIGTEWGRQLIHPDLWIRAWRAAVDRLPAGVPVVVDDCRFPNEAEAVKAAGGVCVRIERPGAGTASKHESEQHQLPAIFTIYNNVSVEDLTQALDAFLRDLSWIET